MVCRTPLEDKRSEILNSQRERIRATGVPAPANPKLVRIFVADAGRRFVGSQIPSTRSLKNPANYLPLAEALLVAADELVA